MTTSTRKNTLAQQSPSSLQRPPAEIQHAAQLAQLQAQDGANPRPPGWALSLKAARSFILGDAAQEYVLHGLRKLACVELDEAGSGDAEIQAVTGQSAKTVAYYRRLADKKKLSRSAQIKREQNKDKT